MKINLAGNELRCDCTLASDIELLERAAGGDGSWLDPSNMADWRQLPCSRPDAIPGRGFAVAEFIDSSNCASERRTTPRTGSTNGNHVTHNDVGITHQHQSLVDRRRRKFAGRKREVATGNAEVARAQSTVKYRSSDARPSRRLSSSGGSAAALVALALCAAMLALLGGLLLCRAGVRRSRDGGRIRQYREKRDLFIVYADDDEGWVTGTLLDVIFTRHPCYDVILQQHLQQDCDARVNQHKWNSFEQMVFGSVIDHSTVSFNHQSDISSRTIFFVSQGRGRGRVQAKTLRTRPWQRGGEWGMSRPRLAEEMEIPLIGVGAQSTLGRQDIFARKYMYET